MADTTAIEWADSTWNPWQGCRKVSEGCANCYMYRDKARYGNDPSIIVRSKPPTFNLPYRLGRGSRVFTCSWSDFFIPLADEWREDAWHIIQQTPFLFYLILTKRPEAIQGRLPSDWGSGYPNVALGVTAENQEMADQRIPPLLQVPAAVHFVSAEPLLGPLDLTRFLSLPPMCPDCGGVRRWDWPPTGGLDSLCPSCGRRGAHDDTHVRPEYLRQVIVGGETGPKARPMHPDWVRGIRDQCQAAGVPFFFKQWGEWEFTKLLRGHACDYQETGGYPASCLNHPGCEGREPFDFYGNAKSIQVEGGYMVRVGKKAAGHLLDGVEYHQFPEARSA